MKHRFHVLVLMERYDHAMRVGIGRLAAEQGWILTVDDGCMLPRGWSGDGILTMLGARQDIVRYVRRQRMPRVDIGDNRPDIALPRVCGDHRLIGQVKEAYDTLDYPAPSSAKEVLSLHREVKKRVEGILHERWCK